LRRICDSTRLDSTRLDSTRLDSTRLDSTLLLPGLATRNRSVRGCELRYSVKSLVMYVGRPTQKFTQNPVFPMPGFGRWSYTMSFLLGSTCIASFALRPTYPTGNFRYRFEKRYSARGFCDSRQARSDGLPRTSLTNHQHLLHQHHDCHHLVVPHSFRLVEAGVWRRR
jgi:hypothetical protein